MSLRDMGLRDYLAELTKQEEDLTRQLENLPRQLEEVRIAAAHARRVLGVDEPVVDVKQIAVSATAPVAENSSKAEDGPKPTGPFTGLGTEVAVLKYLRNTNGRPVKTATIRDGLLGGGIETDAKDYQTVVYGSLRRLVEKGLVEKRGEGSRTRWVSVPEQPVVPGGPPKARTLLDH